MNKVKGNMYNFISHTWNPIKGKCSHDCKYCYMKRFKQKPIRLVEKELGDDLGKGNFIFVGSCIDMFAKEIPREWIIRVLKRCAKFDNTYLFQTKNPQKFIEFTMGGVGKYILGTTIETNRDYKVSNALETKHRFYWMCQLPNLTPKMVSIEPILDFDLDIMIKWIKEIKPKFVSIGADSKGHNLLEPSKEKIENLIKELNKFTNVIEKDNLKRLLKE